MPDILKCYQPIGLNNGLIAICPLQCNRTFSVFPAISGKVLQHLLIFPKSLHKQARYTLQNRVCPQKHLQYTPEALKSILNILKSPEKDEKAVTKHLLSLYFYAFSGLFMLYSPLNSSVYELS